jgi:murein DD-endopeptidase MepM/ murein hydrolase activator NlpD
MGKMMPENISFLVLNKTGSLRKKVTVSKTFIILGLAVFMTGFLGAGFILYDYVQTQKSLYEKTEVEKIVAAQAEEISNQKNHIQIFASKIDLLESEIDKLNNFEKKIRMIADLENENEVEPEGVFGIGGFMSEDLDTKMALEEPHKELIRRMYQQVQQIELAALNQKESFETLFDSLEHQISLMASTPTIPPTKGVITSTFGYRESPFSGRRDFHSGLDIGAKIGTPVKATANGKVTFAGKQGFLGKLVIIDHGHGMLTRYGHLSKILINHGETVKRGDVIGEVGNTGRSTGSHLHYEVHLNGVPVNPQKYFLN